MKFKIKTTGTEINNMINTARGGHNPTHKILATVTDESDVPVKTISVRLSYESYSDTYTIEWMP